MDPVELIKRGIDDIYRKIIAGAENPEEMRTLVDDLRKSYEFLQIPIVARPPGRFASRKMARDAIRDVLEENGKPMTEWEIKDAVVNDGGFRRGDSIKSSRLVVQKSLKLHTTGDGSKKWPLKFINKQYGPKEWPDEWFYERNP